jgi:hypothetical protein
MEPMWAIAPPTVAFSLGQRVKQTPHAHVLPWILHPYVPVPFSQPHLAAQLSGLSSLFICEFMWEYVPGVSWLLNILRTVLVARSAKLLLVFFIL